MTKTVSASKGTGKPQYGEPRPDGRVSFVKFVNTKGYRYAYFNMGRGENGRPLYRRLDASNDKTFTGSYNAALKERERLARVPTTICSLVRAYQLSDRFKRLSWPSQQSYLLALNAVVEAKGELKPDSLTKSDIERIADTFTTKPMRRLFLRVCSTVFGWARASELLPSNVDPTEGLIGQVKRGVNEWVYFIAPVDGRPIKIGRAKDVQRRLVTLQATSPVLLTVIASVQVECAVTLEAALHLRFAKHRLHGEWFERHPDILAEIERLSA